MMILPIRLNLSTRRWFCFRLTPFCEGFTSEPSSETFIDPYVHGLIYPLRAPPLLLSRGT